MYMWQVVDTLDEISTMKTQMTKGNVDGKTYSRKVKQLTDKIEKTHGKSLHKLMLITMFLSLSLAISLIFCMVQWRLRRRRASLLR